MPNEESYPPDAFLDGCEIDFTEDPLSDEESELFVLFAEAFDTESPKSIADIEAEWGEVFNED